MKRILLIGFLCLGLLNVKLWAQSGSEPVTINYCTPSGKPVQFVVKYSTELTDTEIHTLENYTRTTYPHCIILSRASQKYNCHGYAFSVADGNDSVKIGFGTKDSTFFKDTDSYTEIDHYVYPAKVVYAPRWRYDTPNHSAVTTEHPDTLISKSGDYPLVKYYAQDNTPGAGWIHDSLYKFRYFVKKSDLIAGPKNMTCDAEFTLNNSIEGDIRWQVEPAGLFAVSGGTGRKASLSFKQGVSPQIAKAKITFFYKRPGCDNTSSMERCFTASVPSARLDLFIRDTPEDFGEEPNRVSECLWESEDIWVRNQPNEGFSIQTHQNPEYDQYKPVYVYVKVQNKSVVSSDEADTLRLHWAKAGISLGWPYPWDGNTTSPALMGKPIGSIAIPKIESCGSVIFQFEWRMPDPREYNHINDEPWHFCLLARIDSKKDPMTYLEHSGLGNNVQDNNNIAWKNVTVVDNALDSPNPGGTVAITNYFREKKSFRLRCWVPSKEIGHSIINEAEVRITLSEELYIAWEKGGFKGEGVKDMGKNTLLITTPDAYIDELTLYPDELHTAYAGFHFLTQQVSEIPTFKYYLELQCKDEKEEYKMLGGESYVINKWKRDPFKADAGDEKLVLKNENIQLQARSISEPAVYNWYDMNDSLLYTGQNFSTTANQTQKYKLEIIAEKDGYKDYDEVTVRVKEFAIKKISPNPTHTDLTVEYDAANANSASVQIYNSNGVMLRTVSITPANVSVTINVSNYQQGSYSVALVCNGQIADVKTFVVN